MAGKEVVVCIHCKEQCWLKGEQCQDNRSYNKVDCMDGFFVRLLILDDIRENTKEGNDSEPVKWQSAPPETYERPFHLSILRLY